MEFIVNTLRPALLILDLQRLFCSPDGPFENTQADVIINSCNELMNMLASKCPVIYSRYMLASDHSDAGLLGGQPLVEQGYFNAGSEWMEFDERLQVNSNAISTHRNRPGAFWGGELEKILTELDCDSLILAGLSINNAISTTAREAFARDIATIVVREASGAAPWETQRETYFQILDDWTAQVMGMAELQTALSSW